MQIKHAIKHHLGLDLNPDAVYFHKFSSAENDRFAVTGWQHMKEKPIESRTLTECVLHNFSADAQDNLDVLDQMSGIYKVNATGAESFGAGNQVAIRPSSLAKIVWDLDFYNIYISELKHYWDDNQVQEIINIYTVIETLDNFHLTLSNNTQISFLSMVGLHEQSNQQTKKYFLDINGYLATDMLVFEPPAPEALILYMPRAKKAIAFDHLSELRGWIINSCADESQRRAIAQHFCISDRQDSFFFDGIDT